MKYLKTILFTIAFLIGIVMILESNTGMFGDFYSANLAGAIIAIISGVGILLETSKK